MTSARKNLRRIGSREYLVSGPRATVSIDRDPEARRFYVRPSDFPRNGFFAQEFRLLRDARPYAEAMAGVEEVDDFPDPAMPKFLRRYIPKQGGATVRV